MIQAQRKTMMPEPSPPSKSVDFIKYWSIFFKEPAINKTIIR